MDLQTLKKAVDNLLSQGIEGDEAVCLQAGGGQYEVASITVVVESDDWVPGTVLLSVRDARDAEEVEDS